MKSFPRITHSTHCGNASLAVLMAAAAGLAFWQAPAQAGTRLITTGSPVKILVPTEDIGIGWRGPSFDDSAWDKGVNGVGFDAGLGGYGGVLIADSAADWSTAGRQGENGWIYGYYNLTQDPDGVYQASDFQPFPRSDGAWSTSNFWDGGAWNWCPDSVPWDNIGATFIHPNGTNSSDAVNFPTPQEHWSIRRWRSTFTGPATVRFFVRKDNTCGNGVTGKFFLNGTELFSRSILGSDMTGFTVFINAMVTEGDYLDFALTPLGLGSDGADGCDGSVLTARVFAGTILEPIAIADSVSDFSGVQGEKSWFYGFYNKTADTDGIYDPNADFNRTDPAWGYDGSAWVISPGNPPWDNIAQTTWHPNGANNGHIDWVIRRWVSTLDGDVNAHVVFAKDNTGCGSGTTLRVLVNGVEKAAYTVAGGDATGVNTFVFFPGVKTGDTIDFALDPLGTDGASDDSCDGSKLQATIYPGLPFVPGIRDLIATDLQSKMKDVSSSVFLRLPFDVADPAAIQTLQAKIKWNDGYVAYLNGAIIDKRNAPTVIEGVTVANSITDWSTTGEQGINGWYNGYYDRSADDDGVYQTANFATFPHDGSAVGGATTATDFWNGSGYDWFEGNPPWTELYQENFHPNSNNGGTIDPARVGTHEMWVIRRWQATVDGDLKCRVKFAKNPAATCGDGIIGYVLHEGTMVYSNWVAATDSTGRDDVVDLPGVIAGEYIDIAMAPGPNDNCDGSHFSAEIFSGEPSVPWNGAATVARTSSDSITPTVLDLTSMIPKLNAGANVLAIQGLNVSASDNDFLMSAELTANQIPIAADDKALAWLDLPATIPASQLLANDSDPDGDLLTIVGVSPTGKSTAGGTVKLYGETVQYQPAAGFVGDDSFTYTVTDLSGMPVTANVNVTVGNRRIVGGGATPAGVKILFAGVSGQSFTLLRSPTAVAPTWTPVDGPTVAGVDGLVEFTDKAPPAEGAFYKVVLSP